MHLKHKTDLFLSVILIDENYSYELPFLWLEWRVFINLEFTTWLVEFLAWSNDVYGCTSGGYPCLFARPSIKSHTNLNCIHHSMPHVISCFLTFFYIDFVLSDHFSVTREVSCQVFLINNILHSVVRKNGKTNTNNIHGGNKKLPNL